jgi:SAM-dependent methyltransferase
MKQLATVEFKGHNIILDDGRQTVPSLPVLADTGICQAALRTLRLLLPDGGTVADLGCYEGGYAVEFARAGYDVLGIEAKDVNFAKCELVAKNVDLSNMRFVQEDARGLARYGKFDAVFCAGLLYHLNFPSAFLTMLGQVTRKVAIIQTHYAVSCDAQHEGRHGWWYDDFPGQQDLWGSNGNPRSFWLAKNELLQAVRDAGFGIIYRQYDYVSDLVAGPSMAVGPENPEGGLDRIMLTAVKE